MERVLVIDDDVGLCELVGEFLEPEGYKVEAVHDGEAGVEHALEEIFRPFYRVEEACDRQTGGTGLGLAIAARAVRLHGGEIKATNAPDGGLIVEMRLPLKSPPTARS